MKYTRITILCIILLATLCSCTRENWANKTDQLYRQNKKYITIKQGVWGTVTRRTGDWMPYLGERKSGGPNEVPIKSKVRAYEPVSLADFEREGISIYNITDVPSKLVAETTSDRNGFFEMNLQPGEYSLFVTYNGETQAYGFDGIGNIGKIAIFENDIVEFNLVVDNAVY